MARPQFTSKAWRDLAEQPGTGPLRPDLLPGIRFIPIGCYLIFYRESSDGVHILRVPRGARDYGTRDYGTRDYGTRDYGTRDF